jgi:mannose-6-phosphate isomerase-like protein (cupin superfamily)
MAEPSYLEDARRIARRNIWFRHVVHTGPYSQLVLMSIPPGGEIGTEKHARADLIFLVVDGAGEAVLGAKRRAISRDDVIFVAAGTRHNVRNSGNEDLKLLSIIAPGTFAEGTIHRTREDAVGAMVVGASRVPAASVLEAATLPER